MRSFTASVKNKTWNTEKDSHFSYDTLDYDLDRMALVLVDVWERHPNGGWSARAQRNIQEKIVPLLELTRRHNIKVIHAHHLYEGWELSKSIRPLPGETILGPEIAQSTALFDRFLQKAGIKTVLYAGYASNYCVINRPVGIIPVSQLKKYNIIFVRDASLAFETPETVEGFWTHRVITNLIETQFGRSTTVDGLKTALDQ